MSRISKEQFKNYLNNFDFTNLFNQLGWSFLDEQIPVKLKEQTYLFHSVAEKRGFRILVFNPSSDQDLPDYATRLQLERKIGNLFREHLIIFCDKNKTTQIWQLYVKQLGKPSRLSETRWHKGQEPELLYQKTSNLFFTLDQEENITITDVVNVVNENFSKNVEQVTKKFYENFRKEHKKFIEFIKGISVITDREWYASLMLNRLMFCYFIQKKGFLDNNLNYLSDKLKYWQQHKGKDQYYSSFYKNFLMILFHKGLGAPDHNDETEKIFGKIPYLNGGLFDVHELEKQYENIDIGDEAFENIFRFFDQYNWHLDTRINATGRDINPDVIGYIFEKYINDRAQMGAYYTKEDITDYISKNCIIPFLFDETQRRLVQLKGVSYTENKFAEVWQMLEESGDTYIYDAVKKGIDTENLDFTTTISIDDPNHPLWADLPEEIRAGFRPDLKDKIVIADEEPHLWQIRRAWNKPAPENIALPTEIYRELIDRRKRYWEIRKKIDAGEINHINDFITYNLNIRQFAQDVIDNHSDPDFIRFFYEALNNVTILDPTCGSGAFLFAAMNILEPLYESCLMRMRAFVEDEDFENKSDKSTFRNHFKYFRNVLAETQNEHHPNLQYFIYKNIILRNLYGVDIMKEAVEIAKLRLFLKLVATVDPDYKKPNLGLEPLPDIDFNIRSGNTLVGFATEEELQKGLTYTLDGTMAKPAIEEKCEIVANAFKRYKEIQLTYGDDFKEFKKAKEEHNKRLKELNHELNQLLHKQAEAIPYDQWLQSHKPFHWFAEFYEIVHEKGGFDVIIGNPPYVEYSKVRDIYRINNYKTEKCGNLYAFVIERAINILKDKNNLGMIVPLTFIANNNMSELRSFLTQNGNFYSSSYEIRPSSLFEGVEQRLTIFILRQSFTQLFSTSIQRWTSEQRTDLFSLIRYAPTYFNGTIWRLSSFVENSIYQKLLKQKPINLYVSNNYSRKNNLHYRTAGVRYWIIFLNNGFQSKSLSNKLVSFVDNCPSKEIMSTLNSNLFWWYYSTNFDMFNLKDYMIFSFRYNIQNDNRLSKISDILEKDLNKNKKLLITNSKTKGTIESYIFLKKKSKPIIDEIDTVLAEHYGFTEEELDFIINYDIKYRMGEEMEEEEV